MERERQKKLHKIWVVIAETFMVLAVVGIVIIMTFVAMGYNFGKDGEIEQSGLMQLKTIPSGATAELDGTTLFSRTDLSRTLSPGTHHLKLSKNNYDTWEKQINMEPGALMRLYYPRLFLQNRTPELVTELADLSFYTTSVDRESILYATHSSTTWHLLNIAGDDVNLKTLDFTNFFANQSDLIDGTIQTAIWSDDGNKILIRIQSGSSHTWCLMDLQDANESLNLTKEFALDFNTMALANSAATQILALENGNLRKIDINGRSVSRVLLSDIATFSNHGGDIAFVTIPDSAGVRKIGTYKDGAKGSVIVRTIQDDTPLNVTTSAYYDEDYLVYSIGNVLRIYRGQYPEFTSRDKDPSITELIVDLDSDQSVMPQQAELKLSIAPRQLSTSRGGEYIVSATGQQLSVVDLDTNLQIAYTLADPDWHWLDDSMMYSTANQQLVVWDFDNTNRRDLVQDIDGHDVTIATNNKYLYYVKNQQLWRERIVE